MNRYNRTDKVADVPPLVSKRLLDQVRERIRYLHYSPQDRKGLPVLGSVFLFCGPLNRVACGTRATWAGRM